MARSLRRSVRKVGGKYKLFVGGRTPFGQRKFKTKAAARKFLKGLKD